MKKILLVLVLISPPWLKPYVLKWFCGAKLGPGSRVGWFSAVMGRSIEIGAYSVRSNMTLIYGSASYRRKLDWVEAIGGCYVATFHCGVFDAEDAAATPSPPVVLRWQERACTVPALLPGATWSPTQR